MALNLADCLEASAELFPERVAAVMDDFRMTYAELAAAARRVANILASKGLQRGEKVAMMLPNTPHFPIIYYGILYAGATVVPLNVALRRREIEYQLDDSGARLLFVWQDFLEEAAHAFEQAEQCEHLVVVEPLPKPSHPAMGESFAALFAAAAATFDVAQTLPEETAVIMYTSAITGNLRGAELSHCNLYLNALAVKEYVLHYQPEDAFIAALPLFHSFGQTCMMNAAFIAGSKVLFVPRFDAGKVLEIIPQENITILALVPTMYYFLVNFRREQEFSLNSLRLAVTGGSALPLELAREFTARFGIALLEGYGLTETSPVVSFNPSVAENKPGSIGKPIWGCRVRIMREDGSFAAPGEEGEVVVRGHNVMKGYHSKPEATGQTMLGGWFHTGDLGHMDEEGYIFLTGLKKDMLIRAGMNVYPREIEDVLQAHPGILEAAVIGMPDAVRGEEVKAYIVLRRPAALTEKEISTYCREQLASYKCPRRIVVMDKLPRDVAGRLNKKALRLRND
ncbi:MAG: long-chain fatty acid--CoA ligase [Candidatus Hydrogenedentes bacterium]|nr:long-chain fatty acid--CoA ligase [Candidatus Hydrogenedentota bacterium]